jgi:adenosylmethionine-8-amino-7-oxononanoate aminotransferase
VSSGAVRLSQLARRRGVRRRPNSKQLFDSALRLNARFKQEALERGLMTYAMGGTLDGKRGDHVVLTPPFIVTAGDIEMIVAALPQAA